MLLSEWIQVQVNLVAAQQDILHKAMLAPNEMIANPLVLSEVADDVRHAPSESAIIKLLDADARLTPAILKQLAAELNVTLPAAAKAKPAIQLHIAQTVIADSRRLHGGV